MSPLIVTSTHDLPVGVVRWPENRALSVVLKATFSLATSGAVPFAAEQMPISVARPGTKSVPGGLDYPNDFVPFKPDADVLLIGRARQHHAMASLPVRLQVGKWRRMMVASTASPVPELSLSPAWLRDGATGEEAIAGPSALSASSEAVPEWLEPGFDFGHFNSASFEQLVPWIAPGAKVVVDGVFEDGKRRTVTLPRVRPHAAVVSLEEGVVDVQRMAADTLWIDGDAEICVLVWRSVHRFTRPLESSPRIVAVEEPLDSLDDYVAAARAANASRVASEREHFLRDTGASFSVPLASPSRPTDVDQRPDFEDWETHIEGDSVETAAVTLAEPSGSPALKRSRTLELQQGVQAPSALPFAEATVDMPPPPSSKDTAWDEVTSVVTLPSSKTGARGATKVLPFAEQPPPIRKPQLTADFQSKAAKVGDGLPFVAAQLPPRDPEDTADGQSRPDVGNALPFSVDGQAATPIPATAPAGQSESTTTAIFNLAELHAQAAERDDPPPTSRLPDDEVPTPAPEAVRSSPPAPPGLVKTTVLLPASEPPTIGPASQAPATQPEASLPAASPPVAVLPPQPRPPQRGGAAASSPSAAAKVAIPETIGQGAAIGGAQVPGSPLPAPAESPEEPAPAPEVPMLSILARSALRRVETR